MDRIIIVYDSPTGNAYQQLIDYAFDICDQFLLVNRHQMSTTAHFHKILEQLKPWLLMAKEQDRWAGTILYGHTAKVYYYKTNKGAKEIIKENSNSLFDWIQPEFPEDLGFLKKGKVWLMNTAHEKESQIEPQCQDEIDKILAIEGLHAKVYT